MAGFFLCLIIIASTTSLVRCHKASAVLKHMDWKGCGSDLSIDALQAAMKSIDWINESEALIETNRDPPRTMQELQDAIKIPRAGTEKHHIMERTALEKLGFGRREINTPENLVRIPTLKHYEITGWYSQPNAKYGGLSPRQYLADKAPAERMRIGRDALIRFKVLKP